MVWYKPWTWHRTEKQQSESGLEERTSGAPTPRKMSEVERGEPWAHSSGPYTRDVEPPYDGPHTPGTDW